MNNICEDIFQELCHGLIYSQAFAGVTVVLEAPLKGPTGHGCCFSKALLVTAFQKMTQVFDGLGNTIQKPCSQAVGGQGLLKV